MIGKEIALIQVPNQRGFYAGPAARYLGVSQDVLHTLKIPAKALNGRRLYLLDDLNAFLESLPLFESGTKPGENTGRTQPKPAASERTISNVG